VKNIQVAKKIGLSKDSEIIELKELMDSANVQCS